MTLLVVTPIAKPPVYPTTTTLLLMGILAENEKVVHTKDGGGLLYCSCTPFYCCYGFQAAFIITSWLYLLELRNSEITQEQYIVCFDTGIVAVHVAHTFAGLQHIKTSCSYALSNVAVAVTHVTCRQGLMLIARLGLNQYNYFQSGSP